MFNTAQTRTAERSNDTAPAHSMLARSVRRSRRARRSLQRSCVA